MDYRLVGPLDRLERPIDLLVAGLGEHLDRHIVGYQVVLDEVTAEVVVRLAGRREADLDLLESHLDDLVSHAPFPGNVHRLHESLVPVAQVDTAPDRRPLDAAIGP